MSATNLANALYRLQRYEEARAINHDTLAIRRRVRGEVHPDTLASASNLANDLFQLGRVQEALDLDTKTLARRRELFGEDTRRP